MIFIGDALLVLGFLVIFLVWTSAV